MKIAVVQMDAALTDVAQRLDKIRQAVAEAASSGATLVVLPELCVTGYGAGEAIVEAAEHEQKALGDFQQVAETHRIAVVLGLCVAGETGTVNTAALVQPGLPPTVYAKHMLFGEYEKALFAAGTDPSPIVVVDGVRCGLLVCFDVEFPELVRDLAIRGADLVLVPTALPRSEGARFIAKKMIPVRAFENQLFIAYADHCGEDSRFSYQGLSTIAAPDGSVIARAGESDPACLYAKIDPGAYDDCRRQNPYIAEAVARSIQTEVVTPNRES